MRACGLVVGLFLSGIFLMLQASPASPPSEPDAIITDLRQLTKDLNAAVKRFHSDLDQEMNRYDRGDRSPAGQRIPAADADFTGGPADLIAKRKLFAGRMIAASGPGYSPDCLADADRIQELITQARLRLQAGTTALRHLYVVSAKELNDLSESQQRTRIRDLRLARYAATEAAKRALVALPIPLPEADFEDQQRERAWDLMVAKVPVSPRPSADQEAKPYDHDAVLPIRFDEGKRITLVNEHSCRVTLIDSGIEDGQGRRLFYQEEWVMRQGSLARTGGTGPGGVVILKRWAVAVNTNTGQHTLLRRYQEREFRGYLEEFRQLEWNDHVLHSDLPDTPKSPSLQDLASAVESVKHARDSLQQASSKYKRAVQEALTRNDALLANDKFVLDDELPDYLRVNLFAIRSHMASVTGLLAAENEVRKTVDRTAAQVQFLEAMVAWVNGAALERESPAQDSRALLLELNRADREIEFTRGLQQDAVAALPPDLSSPEAQFPGLMKDVILRIRRLGLTNDPGGTVRCRQEVWWRTGPRRGVAQVKRTIIPIDIELATGRQIPAGREVKYYRLDDGDTLEQIYDENAAQ